MQIERDMKNLVHMKYVRKQYSTIMKTQMQMVQPLPWTVFHTCKFFLVITSSCPIHAHHGPRTRRSVSRATLLGSWSTPSFSSSSSWSATSLASILMCRPASYIACYSSIMNVYCCPAQVIDYHQTECDMQRKTFPLAQVHQPCNSFFSCKNYAPISLHAIVSLYKSYCMLQFHNACLLFSSVGNPTPSTGMRHAPHNNSTGAGMSTTWILFLMQEMLFC